MTLGEEVVEDYVAMRLTLRAHPLALLRYLLTPGFSRPTPPVATTGPDQTRAALARAQSTRHHPRNVRFFS